MSDQRPLGEHRCRAKGCRVMIPRHRFMCLRHWYMVPQAMRPGLLNTAYTRHQDTRIERYRVILLALVARRIVQAREDRDDYRAALEWVRYTGDVTAQDLEEQLEIKPPRARAIIARLVHCHVIDDGDLTGIHHIVTWA